MRSINVAEVITAAAASSLGVLSLIILAVAFIGYNFFKRSGDAVKAGVWAVMLLAAIGFGVAVVRQGQQQARAEPPPRPSPTSDGYAPEPVDTPTPEPRTGTPVPSPSANVDAVDAAPVDTSGRWRDTRGYIYDVAARGGDFVFEQGFGGVHTASGRGTIAGRRVRYEFVVDRTMQQGTCQGLLSADARRVEGTCEMGGQPWEFISVR